jgi:hypothetical protein
MIKRFIKWLLNLFKAKRPYKTRFVDEVPNTLDSKIIYIIENKGYRWKAVMICPCGCNKILHMNLIKDYNPSWKFEINKKKTITLHPSINRTVGCKSHFFIRKGKVIWTKL